MVAKNYIFGRKYGSNFLTNLVAYYPLNGNAVDAINGLNGANTSISYLTGNVGLGANFLNNTTSRIEISDTNFLSFTDGLNDIPLTIVSSVRQTDSGINYIFTKFNNLNDIGNVKEYAFLIVNNKVRFLCVSGNTNFLRAEGNTSLSLNTWHNLVVTYDGSKLFSGIKIYVNGVEQTLTNLNVGTYTGMTNTTTTPLIGNVQIPNAGEAMSGMIDELYIYKNRVLSATEVSEVYTKFLAQQPLI
jgi:hypothetical protein